MKTQHNEATSLWEKFKQQPPCEPVHATIEPVREYTARICKTMGSPYSIVTIPEGNPAYIQGFRFACIPNALLEQYLAGGATLVPDDPQAAPDTPEPTKGKPMGARTSNEMKQARILLWTGKTGYAAAKETGISEGAISKCKVCQSIIKAVSNAKMSLSNDESSTDAELLAYFEGELGMPANHARAWVKQRDHYLNNIVVDAPKGAARV